MDFRVIIPARYNSSRLPAKALVDIAGKPMVQHVYEKAKKSRAKTVVVATDDDRIAGVCKKIGAEFCMTDPNHLTGTDRISEVISLLRYEEDEIIVNVQGDQPLVPFENIDQVANNLALNPEAGVATLCEVIRDSADLHNPSMVKTVFDNKNFALYFSRSLVPYHKSPDLHLQIYYKHIGLYAYRAGVIQQFVKWDPTPIELSESLEQLRFLSNGQKIHIDVAIKNPPIEVNTEEDLIKIRQWVAAHVA
ncbi:MAG: 3-deoxy-manno-octulosonate cytidylyltransferase [Gammaproteobacteria bacterium]|nr:3-deoxy-manno-octulosonate cytidylyltransferase [Gammaproteobacteria bacterium]